MSRTLTGLIRAVEKEVGLVGRSIAKVTSLLVVSLSSVSSLQSAPAPNRLQSELKGLQSLVFSLIQRAGERVPEWGDPGTQQKRDRCPVLYMCLLIGVCVLYNEKQLNVQSVRS